MRFDLTVWYIGWLVALGFFRTSGVIDPTVWHFFITWPIAVGTFLGKLFIGG